MILRPWALSVALLATLAGCGAAGENRVQKPARLHATPVTADLVATRGETQDEYFLRQAMLVNQWVKQSGGGSAGVSLLDAVHEARDQTGKQTRWSQDDLELALRGWLKSAQGRDSVRLAAAYLAADRVLALAWRPFHMTDPDPAVRARLKTLGAEVSGASGEMTYEGTWLQTAQRLNPMGPIGQRAALIALEADCAGGDSPDAYHSIIGRLETLVASPADSEVKFTAEVLEADAYRDIVALGRGFGKGNADSTKFLPEADSSKTKAIILYEAAVAVDSTSRLSRGAALAHDRLATAQPLDHVRFFCFGD
ncbi:MAG TPA: hypothetical protein VH116_08610 [Gemmatimonadales bacterium]|jgi:hypothetical protein|nr:hypothetical protein [Gemmatimonadales bacterium]